MPRLERRWRPAVRAVAVASVTALGLGGVTAVGPDETANFIESFGGTTDFISANLDFSGERPLPPSSTTVPWPRVRWSSSAVSASD